MKNVNSIDKLAEKEEPKIRYFGARNYNLGYGYGFFRGLLFGICVTILLITLGIFIGVYL